MEEYNGSIVKTCTLKKDSLLGCLTVTVLLTVIFVDTADTRNIEAIVSQPINSTLVSELIQKGNMLFNKSKYEEAIQSYDQVLMIDPRSIDSLNGKGLAFNNLGRYEEAIIWFDKAIKIDPNFVDALYNKGGALGELGKYQEAIVWTNKALDIDISKQNASNSKQLILPNE